MGNRNNLERAANDPLLTQRRRKDACLCGLAHKFAWRLGGHRVPSLSGRLPAQRDPAPHLLLFIYDTVAASGLVIATTVIGLRARLVPRWLGHAGYLLSGLLLVGFSGPPLFLLMLWIAGISIALHPRT